MSFNYLSSKHVILSFLCESTAGVVDGCRVPRNAQGGSDKLCTIGHFADASGEP